MVDGHTIETDGHTIDGRRPFVTPDRFFCLLFKRPLTHYLYGLKQGANEWNRKFNDILITNGLKRSENDPCLYSSQENGEWMYISIHVDDLIVAATKDYMFKEFEKRMGHTLNIKNLGDL